MKKSKESFQSILIKESHCEVSIYDGELTKECIAGNIIKLKKTFNELPPEFYDVFSNRLIENGFDDKRLTDAVNHVIDNCVYPKPSIAQFISFDKKKKLYSHSQVCALVDKYGSSIWEEMSKTKVNGKLYWYRESEN